MANPPPPPPPPGAPAAAAAAAARPARIDGVWTDDRTPAAELYFPSVVTAHARRRSAQAPTNQGRIVRGVANVTPITYGNRVTEVTNFLNSKDAAPPPAVRKAAVTLPFVSRTMSQVLVAIIDAFHYLAIQTISAAILKKKSITGKNARPLPHVVTSKQNIMAAPAGKRLITLWYSSTSNGMSLPRLDDLPPLFFFSRNDW